MHPASSSRCPQPLSCRSQFLARRNLFETETNPLHLKQENVSCFLHNSSARADARIFFQRSRQAQYCLFIGTVETLNIRYRRCTGCDCTGFIKDNVLILYARSRLSAFFISTPSDAPLPVPTIIAVGVASPSAHGHAMTRTAMAFMRAAAKPAPIREIPNTECRKSNHHHNGYKDRCDIVGEMLDGRFGTLRFFHKFCNVRNDRIRTDGGSAKFKTPVFIYGTADNLIARNFFYGNTFAAHHRLINEKNIL
jgi:hypothetical protein